MVANRFRVGVNGFQTRWNLIEIKHPVSSSYIKYWLDSINTSPGVGDCSSGEQGVSHLTSKCQGLLPPGITQNISILCSYLVESKECNFVF